MSSPLEIWVDGSCIQKEHGLTFGWAFTVYQEDTLVHQSAGSDVLSEAVTLRNIAAEVTAVLRALAWCQAHQITTVRIYFDYQGLRDWITGSWKAKTAFTKAYVQAVHQLGISIEWTKIQAHSGVTRNEQVDRLANYQAHSAQPIFAIA